MKYIENKKNRRNTRNLTFGCAVISSRCLCSKYLAVVRLIIIFLWQEYQAASDFFWFFFSLLIFFLWQEYQAAACLADKKRIRKCVLNVCWRMLTYADLCWRKYVSSYSCICVRVYGCVFGRTFVRACSFMSDAFIEPEESLSMLLYVRCLKRALREP